MVCHRIAGDAGTEFGGKQKLKLWELSQRCLHLREQQLCDKLYSGKIDPAANPLFPFPIPASSNDGKVSVRESTDLSNFTTGALDFSLVASIWHYHQLRQLIIMWLMTWLRQKNWRKKVSQTCTLTKIAFPCPEKQAISLFRDSKWDGSFKRRNVIARWALGRDVYKYISTQFYALYFIHSVC